ncbi:MAG: hypothetical protein IJS26_04830 [Alphaproteobacteria bacterium]|nr:hypothetical protein [Alphaproteobacteria bacterium]
MLNETVLYLFLIGVVSLVHTNRRYDFLLSFAAAVFVCVVFGAFLLDFKTGLDSSYTLVLDASQNTNIKLDIISSPQNYILILPFFVMTILAMFNNAFFKYEPNKKNMAACFVFNLLSLIMLISGHNFIQMMTFVLVVDILSQLFIRDMRAGRLCSLYNLVSDMGLFLVLAMLEGKLSNLDVGNISHYYETGKHRDFIMFVVMFSLCIKFGFFLFQGYWLDLKKAKFHNLYFLPYLSSSMAALILLVKFYPILVVSPSFLPLVNWLSVLTAVFGTIGAVLSSKIKEKFMYFNMIVMAFLVKLLERLDFQWNIYFSTVLILCFILSMCFYYFHYDIERKQAANKPAVFLEVLTTIGTASAIVLQTSFLFSKNTSWWILGFALVLCFVLALLCRQILSGVKNVKPLKPTDFLSISVMLFLNAFVLFLCRGEAMQYWVVLLFWACLMFVYYLTGFINITKTQEFEFQDVDFLGVFLRKCFITPFKKAGLLINILTDFILLERTFFPLLSGANIWLIRTYRKISRMGLSYYFLCMLFGFLISFYLFIRSKQ